MNTFKRKSLYAALAGVSALGATGAAQAVNVNPDGLGQVLLYPYYTVRSDSAGNAYNTLLTVVNTTSSSKAVKVRFLEGKNSREVLDFNLFLSPYDVWSAALKASSTGGTLLLTVDKSCTLPQIPAAGVEFKTTLFTDGGGTGLDRTREGYFEMIEMGSIITGSTTDVNVTHVSGVPPGCSSLSDTQANLDTQAPTGGLMGSLSLLNVTQGSDYTADPTVLDSFFVNPGFASLPNNYGNAGTIFPDLTTVKPKTSVVFNNGSVVMTTWPQPIIAPPPGVAVDPVSAVLMHDNVLNEWVTRTDLNAATDWVITMPTKRYYIGNGSGTPPRLFQRNFVNGTVGACDDVTLNIFDREERTTTTQLDFSPPSVTPTNSICWEANVITFNAKVTSPVTSNVFGSTNAANIPVPGSFPVAEGWLKLGFPVVGTAHFLGGGATTTFSSVTATTTTSAAATYFGLPTIGFAVQSFANNTMTVGTSTVLSNYGGNWQHKFTRNIQ